jgi:prefoldin subunit 5
MSFFTSSLEELESAVAEWDSIVQTLETRLETSKQTQSKCETCLKDTSTSEEIKEQLKPLLQFYDLGV